MYNCTGESFDQEKPIIEMTIFTMISHIAIRTYQTHNVTYFRTLINQSNSYLPRMLTLRNWDRILTDLFGVNGQLFAPFQNTWQWYFDLRLVPPLHSTHIKNEIPQRFQPHLKLRSSLKRNIRYRRFIACNFTMGYHTWQPMPNLFTDLNQSVTLTKPIINNITTLCLFTVVKILIA